MAIAQCIATMMGGGGGGVTLWLDTIVIIKNEFVYINAEDGSPLGVNILWELDMLTMPYRFFETTQHSVFSRPNHVRLHW